MNQRGDTLVEVVMSLAILTVILVTSFNVANLSFRLGMQARERTQAANINQRQAELLRQYRDSYIAQHPDQTLPAYARIFGNGDCGSGSAGCFMTQLGDAPQIALCSGSGLGPCNQSGLFKTITHMDATQDGIYKFTIETTWKSLVGDDDNVSKFDYTLVDKRGLKPLDCSDVTEVSCQ